MVQPTYRILTLVLCVSVITAPVAAQRLAGPIGAHRAAVAASTSPLTIPADKASGGFANSGFAQFMASPAGRVLRAVAGAGMIAGGVAIRDDHRTGGTVLGVAGLIPLSAGLFDVCYISPLFGGPFTGKAIRSAGK